ncbi:hypothetical protein E2562_030348 [Oryza meyeriana var. granulata]|uniref:Uncharacterized protein n=1 Tax=Oryza meyeriana var. granulata TaxID=110450 RepID=A0A6G1D9A0_9ORYZ|nr:hypothetical protein E2562_030348 [Oryza meyeriana var. granulata]
MEQHSYCWYYGGGSSSMAAVGAGALSSTSSESLPSSLSSGYETAGSGEVSAPAGGAVGAGPEHGKKIAGYSGAIAPLERSERGITHSSSQHQQPFMHISLSPSFDGGLVAAAICGGLQLPPCHGRVVVVASCCCLLATPTSRTSCDLRGRQPVAAELVPAATRTQAGRSTNQKANNLRGASSFMNHVVMLY